VKKWVIIAEVAFVLAMAGLAIFFNAQAERERTRTRQAVERANADRQALEAMETYTQKTIVIREKSNAATVRIKEAPQAESPVPDDVLSAWRDGIDQLRGKEPAKPDNPASVP
jgi:hypothetical protein